MPNAPQGLTVKDLVKMLSMMDPNALIVASRDEEGNGFSPVYGIEIGHFIPDLGELAVTEDDREELEQAGYAKEFIDSLMYKGNDAVPCVIIWPSH